MRRVFSAALACACLYGCKDKDVDASGADEDNAQGDPCTAAEDGADPPCAEGLACEPTADGTDGVCSAPLEIRGVVLDALSGQPIEGAHVSALDETGAPVSDVAVSDAGGLYALQVSARRDEDGTITDALKWTLFATAADYQPFPAGVRPAIPVNALDAIDEPTDDDRVVHVIENASTDVALLLLPEDARGGRTISGTAAAGTLVVAEGPDPAPYTIADASGAYTLFNVPDAEVSITGYRQGFRHATAVPSGAGDHENVALVVEVESVEDLPSVQGSIQLVNAPGDALTSVVLVPVSVYNDVLERGPVPLGLRAPQPPGSPDVAGGFTIGGVPPGTYKVLAAFENDHLVRDPDTGIGGTNIQEIVVDGSDIAVSESFKVTEDIAVVEPGAEAPEVVGANPTFVWADDSSEAYYHLVVFDAFGELVWEDPEVPRVTGGQTVEVTYGGPALTPGMYYQFRATSVRDRNDGPTPISRTEDLRGVFVAG